MVGLQSELWLLSSFFLTKEGVTYAIINVTYFR